MVKKKWVLVKKMVLGENIVLGEYMVFTNSAPLGRVGHRLAMSVVVSVCLSACAIAKHPLPEVV